MLHDLLLATSDPALSQQGPGWTHEIVVGVIGGLIGSIIWLLIVLAYQLRKYSSRYRCWEGKYLLCSVENRRMSENRYVLVKRSGRGFIITCHYPDGPNPEDWVSNIIMSEDIPYFGQGTYQHQNKLDCGIHQIQLNKKEGSIYVFFHNTSHGMDTKGTYILRRLPTPSGSAGASDHTFS